MTDRRAVVIVGGGPAAYSAAIYAARANLRPLCIEGYASGGMLMTTGVVENYPGFAESVTGPEIMLAMREQAERFGCELVAIRASDFVARFGGEEFLVVLTNTNLDGVIQACDKLREAIAALRIPGVGQSPSASFGVATFPDDGTDPEELVRGADRALYAAKSSGRNCVRTLHDLSSATVA